MSFNRENVVWQSSDGTWSRGFFTVHEMWDVEDFDPEWDVEYDTSTFEWASVGHATEEAAYAAWDGANPGGSTVLEWTADPGTQARCARYDVMAADLRERAARR